MSEETIESIPTFTLSCASGVTFEIPSNTPGLTAGGFQIDDDASLSYEYVVAFPDEMPLQYKQFALAHKRNRPV